jgi:hypothetical protein
MKLLHDCAKPHINYDVSNSIAAEKIFDLTPFTIHSFSRADRIKFKTVSIKWVNIRGL